MLLPLCMEMSQEVAVCAFLDPGETRWLAHLSREWQLCVSCGLPGLYMCSVSWWEAETRQQQDRAVGPAVSPTSASHDTQISKDSESTCISINSRKPETGFFTATTINTITQWATQLLPKDLMLKIPLFYEAASLLSQLVAPAKTNQYPLPDMCAYDLSHQSIRAEPRQAVSIESCPRDEFTSKQNGATVLNN